MPNKISIKGEIVKRYLAEFPKLNPTQMAHRIMSNDISKNHFKNIEDARNIVRCYMGKLGQKNRQKMASNQFYRDKLNIPYGEKNEIKHYKIPSKVKKILLLSDIHVPYHDEVALQTALEYGIEQEIDCIILNGDFIDFYAVSRWETDYRKRNFANEIMIARNILQVIRDVFPLAHIVYKIGNHDDRWSQFLLRNELKGIDDIELSGLLKFQELGITEVKSMATIWANKLAIIHGHEHKYGMIAPVNPARGLFLRTKQSALMSHVHRVSEHTEKTHDGKLIGCWSTGCLCHDDQTEILTDKGFVFFEKLKSNDKVLEYNQQTKQLKYRKPLAIQKYKYNGIMHHYESNRISQMVTPEHKMLTNRGDTGNKIMTSQELFNRKKNLNLFVAGKYDEDINEKEYHLGELFGFIITDGSYREKTNGIRIYQKNKYKRVKYLLEYLDIKYTESMSRDIPCFNIPSEIGKHLRKENPIKIEISDNLLNKGYSFLKGLYEGLIGGDGHRKKNNITDYYATHNYNTALRFQELCCKIGYSAVVKKFEGIGNNITDKYWYMYKCFVKKKDVSEIKTKSEVSYNGYVYDVSTKDGFFVVRRNGKVSISGNCELTPEYMPYNNHNHGFALIELHDKEMFTVYNKKIINGKVY